MTGDGVRGGPDVAADDGATAAATDIAGTDIVGAGTAAADVAAGGETVGDTSGAGRGAVAAELLAGARDAWAELAQHPFVAQAADGTLPRADFDRWLVTDHYFVAGFRRFLTGLVTLAPDERAADVLSGAIGVLQGEIDLFRREATARGLDLDGFEPGPIALGYTAYLRAALQDGYPVALAVLYGAEKAYFDAWSAVRAGASRDSEYWSFVDNWSSPAFAAWVDDVGELLDTVAPRGATPEMRRAFDRVVRFELRFWDAVHTGDPW